MLKIETKKTNFIFIGLTVFLLHLLNILLLQKYILTDNLYAKSLSASGGVDSDFIRKFIALKHKLSFVSLGIYLTFQILRIYTVSFCIYIGAKIFEVNIKFKTLTKIVLIAEFVFLVFLYYKFYILILNPITTIEEFKLFGPLSLWSFFQDSFELKYGFYYVLQQLNLFELLYWIVLAILLTKATKEKFYSMFSLIIKSYGTCLLLYLLVSLLMFNILN